MFILQHLPPPVNVQISYIFQLFLNEAQKAPGSGVLLGAGWGSVLRGGVGQLKADGNVGLAANGLCADT